jgi:hypothetical protein
MLYEQSFIVLPTFSLTPSLIEIINLFRRSSHSLFYRSSCSGSPRKLNNALQIQ